AHELQAKHPHIVLWPVAEERMKISAAWMIDACGFKGLREGDAGVSNRHALILVNHGKATGAELWALAQRVREGVQQRFGILLEPEPRIL
ncbi:MAG TPA: UDP-N-acetylenolpyruvoylglucosamine reductase, partial [Mizugakiibacter sp.]|nr:UDP-N-acetylenolpyruvoylglucosamine reductase [Mizugakiibacter sp.]